MSCFLDSISTIVTIFHEYAKEDGDIFILSRREMKEFILKEFADVIANPRDSQTIDKILHFLEWDGDGKIDFNEFLFLIFRVAKACYWYLQKGPCLLQKTKLITRGKSLQEPETNNKRQHQPQEEEREIHGNTHQPDYELQPQYDTKVYKLKIIEEDESDDQRSYTLHRGDATRASRSEDSTSQVYEERSQKPSKRNDFPQPPELDEQEDVQSHSASRKPKPLVEERGSYQTRQPERKGDVRTQRTPHESESQVDGRGSLQAHRREPQADERQNQERFRPNELADVKSHNQTRQPPPLRNRWISHEAREPAPQMYDEENHHPQDQEEAQEADRRSDIQPQKTELLPNRKSAYHRRELEAGKIDGGRRQAREQEGLQRKEVECLDQSYIDEPIEVEQSCYEKYEPRRNVYEEITHRSEPKPENLDRQKRRIQAELREERDDERRKREPHANERTREHFQDQEINCERKICRGREREEPAQDRRIIRSRELEADASGSIRRETREREERGPIDTYERTRRNVEVAADADVRVRRVTREREPRGDGGRRVHSHDSEPAKPCDKENRTVEPEQETLVPDASCEGEGSSGKTFYHTIVLDTKDLSLQGEQGTVSGLSTPNLPNEPDVRRDVKVLPPPCDPHTVAYLIQVIQNLKDPQAVTYKVVCPQPKSSAQPVYVTKSYTPPRPSATPREGSSHQEAERGEDNSKAGGAEELEATQRTGPSVPEAQQGRDGNQQPADSRPEDRKERKEQPEVQDKEGPHEQDRAETEAKEEGQQEAPAESVRDESARPRKGEAGDTKTNEQRPRPPEPNTERQENASKERVPRARESERRPAPRDEQNQAQPQEGESRQREEGQQQNQRAEGKAKAPEYSPEPRDSEKDPETQESRERKAPARRTGQRAAEEPKSQPRNAEEGDKRSRDQASGSTTQGQERRPEQSQEGRPEQSQEGHPEQSRGPEGSQEAPRRPAEAKAP